MRRRAAAVAVAFAVAGIAPAVAGAQGRHAGELPLGRPGLPESRSSREVGRGPLGFLVRVGSLDSESQAQALRDLLAADGYNGLRVVYVPERELLTSIAGRSGALAALNGGYFVIGPDDGTPGDLAGISMLDGELVSEAVNGRTSLLVPGPSGAGARVAAMSTRLTVAASDGARREVDARCSQPRRRRLNGDDLGLRVGDASLRRHR